MVSRGIIFFIFYQILEPAVNLENDIVVDSVPPIISNNGGTSVECDIPVPRKRRRFAVEQEWKRNVQKKRRAFGESYTNYKKAVVPTKTVKETQCKECRYHCSDKIPKVQQENLLKAYWSYGDASRQKDFICSLVTETTVAQKRKRDQGSERDKTFSRVYTLPNGSNENVRVCLPFFCATFSISKSIIKKALLYKSPQGTYKGHDRRKGRPAPNATPSGTIRAINRFLADFPKVPSHYCRARSNRLYLAPDLSIKKLHELYTNDTPSHPVTYRVFRNIFKHYEPPLAIFQPKKDQCSICNEAERTNTRETNKKYIEHIQRKESIAVMKKQDKADASKNPSLIYATFDLQAILTLPFSGECQIYYKRKLSMYNFTIFDSRGVGTCYTWDENNGRKGSSEIGSCLLRYIKSLPSTVNKVIFYADTCGGQNRNQNIFALLLYAVNAAAEHIESIDLKFMESGHSTMEADSMHGAIERAKKGKLLYVPNDYVLIMKMARKDRKGEGGTTGPYNVNLLHYHDFYDLEFLTKSTVVN